jgi:hypothetical protein
VTAFVVSHGTPPADVLLSAAGSWRPIRRRSTAPRCSSTSARSREGCHAPPLEGIMRPIRGHDLFLLQLARAALAFRPPLATALRHAAEQRG